MTKLLMDGWDKDAYEKYSGIIDGVTCNPANLSVSREGLAARMLSSGKKIFMQTNDFDEVATMREGKDVIWKVPAHPKYQDLVDNLKKNGYMVCATMVYTLPQILLAQAWKCDYTIILVHKNPDKLFCTKVYEAWPTLLETMYKADDFATHPAKKLRAMERVGGSFRTLAEVESAIQIGIEYVTLRPDILAKMFEITAFDIEHEKYYG